MSLPWLSSGERTYFQRTLLTLAKSETPKNLSIPLRKAGLPSQLIKDILDTVEKLPTSDRALTALKYVALAQAGIPLKPANLPRKVNLPRFEGVSYPQQEQESDFGEFQEHVTVANPAQGRTRYLDEAQESLGKLSVSTKLQSKVVPSDEDLSSPTEVEEEKQSSFRDTDLLDFTEVPATFGKHAVVAGPASQQTDLLSSDFFMPAPKNSLARGSSKAFVFPADSKPPPKSQASAVANRLPSFSTQPHRSQTTVEKPLSAKEVLENEVELNKLRNKLIQFMRLEEAEQCQTHLELLAKVKQLYVQKKEAMIRDIADDANDYRKIILNLKEQMASEKDVIRWMQPISENKITTLYRELRLKVSEESVRVLREEFRLDSLQPDKDIHSALVLVQEAFEVSETWLAVGAQHQEYLSLVISLLQTCKEELTRASRLLPKLRRHLHLAVQDPNYETYIRAVPVVYQIADRCAHSVRHLAMLYSGFQAVLKIVEAVTAQWKLCEPHLSVKKEPTKEKSEEVCGLCLRRGAELSHEGGFYHPPCINWWQVRIASPLTFKTQM